MTVRRVARFRRNPPEQRTSNLRRVVMKAALRALDLVAISVVLLLVAAPFAWRFWRANEYLDTWSQTRFDGVSSLETDWMTLPIPPPFTRGDEPQVRIYLDQNPLVVALRDHDGELWVRQGLALHRGDAAGDAKDLATWFAMAEQARCFLWYPSDALQGGVRPGPAIVLSGPRWMVAKRWREGSPEVEQFLRHTLGKNSLIRIALLKDGDENRQDWAPQPWGEEPRLQVDPYRVRKPLFSAAIVSNEFPGWNLTMVPFLAEALAYRRYLAVQFSLVAAASCLMGGSLVLALYLRYRARRGVALDADRMASMTHSLKTPLAILKFRCDTLRLGRVPPDEMDTQLIKIGEEADRLSNIIENALMALQGPREPHAQGTVTPQWIADIAADLAPAFEAGNRHLVLNCSGHEGRAALPSLRAALFTLMENALFHGEGTVTLETLRVRKRLIIRVKDEGFGMGAQELKALGHPFLRLRKTGQEGFRNEGQGLGLSLLTRVVEREGWGLIYASEPGKGLAATLEIPAI